MPLLFLISCETSDSESSRSPNVLASQGHATAQYLHPTHSSESTVTLPSGCFLVAPVGQTFSHSGSLQCMHRRGTACRITVGYLPDSILTTFAQNTPGGV